MQTVSKKTAGGVRAEMEALTCARRSSMSRGWGAAMMMGLWTTVIGPGHGDDVIVSGGVREESFQG
jgi:hypothetical protein